MAKQQQQQQDFDLETVKEEIVERANEFAGQAAEFARARPHVAVGLAFGVGWVLGNGLPPRVVMAAARLGWKAMLGGMLASSGVLGMINGSEAEPTTERPAVRRSGPRQGRHEAAGRDETTAKG